MDTELAEELSKRKSLNIYIKDKCSILICSLGFFFNHIHAYAMSIKQETARWQCTCQFFLLIITVVLIGLRIGSCL